MKKNAARLYKRIFNKISKIEYIEYTTNTEIEYIKCFTIPAGCLLKIYKMDEKFKIEIYRNNFKFTEMIFLDCHRITMWICGFMGFVEGKKFLQYLDK